MPWSIVTFLIICTLTVFEDLIIARTAILASASNNNKNTGRHITANTTAIQHDLDILTALRWVGKCVCFIDPGIAMFCALEGTDNVVGHRWQQVMAPCRVKVQIVWTSFVRCECNAAAAAAWSVNQTADLAKGAKMGWRGETSTKLTMGDMVWCMGHASFVSSRWLRPCYWQCLSLTDDHRCIFLLRQTSQVLSHSFTVSERLRSLILDRLLRHLSEVTVWELLCPFVWSFGAKWKINSSVKKYVFAAYFVRSTDVNVKTLCLSVMLGQTDAHLRQD